MTQRTILENRQAFVAQLDEVRAAYKRGRNRHPDLPATNPDVRYAGWSEVNKLLQWSITDDAADDVIRPDDVNLYRKVRARKSDLVGNRGAQLAHVHG